MSEILKMFAVQNMKNFILDTVAKKVKFSKDLGQMVRVSQKFIIIFIKKLLKSTTLFNKSNT